MNTWQLGKAFAYAHEKIAARIDISSHSWCYVWYSAHLFGDPAQILRIQDTEPDQIIINNENSTSPIKLKHLPESFFCMFPGSNALFSAKTGGNIAEFAAERATSSDLYRHGLIVF